MSQDLITGDAGRIGFLIKGKYDNSATYDFLDIVYYEGAAYVAKKETTGNPPVENNEFWQIFAGIKASSVTGVKGEKETEYRVGDVNITAANVGALSLTEGNNAISRNGSYIINLKSTGSTMTGMSFFNIDGHIGTMYLSGSGEFAVWGSGETEGTLAKHVTVSKRNVGLGKQKNEKYCIGADDNGVYHYGKKLYEEGDSPQFEKTTISHNEYNPLVLKSMVSEIGIEFFNKDGIRGQIWFEENGNFNLIGKDNTGDTKVYARVKQDEVGLGGLKNGQYCIQGKNDGVYHYGKKLYKEGELSVFRNGINVADSNLQVWSPALFFGTIIFGVDSNVTFRNNATFNKVPQISGGYTGTFKTGDNKTVTVTNGIITAVQ